MIDASTGLLADTTFYFKNQRHDLTQYNDIILKLAMELIAHDEITDVYASPDFPQFNNGRNVKNLLELLDTAKGVNQKLLTKRGRTQLNAAIDNAQTVLSKTVDEADALQKAEQQLSDALVRVGAKAPSFTFPDIFTPIADRLYAYYGSNGYSEMPVLTLKKALDSLTAFFGLLLQK